MIRPLHYLLPSMLFAASSLGLSQHSFFIFDFLTLPLLVLFLTSIAMLSLIDSNLLTIYKVLFRREKEIIILLLILTIFSFFTGSTVEYFLEFLHVSLWQTSYDLLIISFLLFLIPFTAQLVVKNVKCHNHFIIKPVVGLISTIGPLVLML